MKYLLYLAILAGFLAGSTISHADEVFLGYGTEMFSNTSIGEPGVEYFTGGYRQEHWTGLYWQSKVSLASIGRNDYGVKTTGLLASGLGFRLQFGECEARVGESISLITTPDKYLGGIFPQFNGELYLGARDKSGLGLGVSWNHISSAGIYLPNRGKDFLAVELSQRF